MTRIHCDPIVDNSNFVDRLRHSRKVHPMCNIMHPYEDAVPLEQSGKSAATLFLRRFICPIDFALKKELRNRVRKVREMKLFVKQSILDNSVAMSFCQPLFQQLMGCTQTPLDATLFFARREYEWVRINIRKYAKVGSKQTCAALETKRGFDATRRFSRSRVRVADGLIRGGG